MKRVLAFGTFDLLHPGHVHYLSQAKSLGDELVVVVARDDNVKRFKGKKPINSERARLRLIQSLKVVDQAVLGYSKNMFRIVKRWNPAVVALGYDQRMSENHLKKQLSLDGLNPTIVRLRAYNPRQFKSAKIQQKIRESA